MAAPVTTPAENVTLSSGRARVSAWWVSTTAWIVMVLLLPMMWSTDFVGTVQTRTGATAFLLIAASASAFCRLLAVGAPRCMTLCFWTFVYVWFGLAAFLQLDNGSFGRRIAFVGRPYSEAVLSQTLLIVCLGCIAYQAGSSLYRSRGRQSALRSRTVISLARLRTIAFLGSGAAAVLIVQSGATIFSRRDEYTGFDESLATKIIRGTALIGGYLVLYCFRHHRVFTWRAQGPWSKVLFVATVLLALVANNPTVVSRALFATAYGAFLLAFIDLRKPRSVRVVFLALPIILLVIYPWLNNFRSTDSPTYAARTAEGIAEPLRIATGDFGMFSQVAEGVEWVDEFGHSRGRFLAASVFVLVPRSIWTSKSQDMGDTIHDARGYDDQFNYPSPMWMEFYVEGGYPLVIVGFTLLGWFSRSLETRFLLSPRSLAGAMMPILACYQFFVLRGSLLAAAPFFWMFVLLLSLCCSIVPPVRIQYAREDVNAQAMVPQ